MGSVPLPGDGRHGQAVLPAEALPAEGGEVARNLAAITISDKVMDEDMRAIITGEVSRLYHLHLLSVKLST